MVHFITDNKRFNELNEAYLETICEEPKLLFDSEEFLSLKEDELKLILKCDGLDMKEIEIWKKLIKWGFAQNTMLESDIMCEDTNNEDMCEDMCEDTNNEDMCEDKDINVLKKTLSELIKFIRFHQMDHEEFMPVVWKYRHPLSEQLIEDIFTCFLDSDIIPSYNPFLIRWGNFKIDSVLINKEIALLLTKWIDKKTIDDETPKGFHYEFNLLFRSSLDGLSSQVFHRRCDNKGATIVVVKDQDSSFLFGGYNPFDWDCQNVWKRTTNSFIFALDYNNLENATVSRIDHDNSNHAIACDKNFGPFFGEGPDLCVKNNSNIWKLKIKSYPKIAEANSLTALDYEVFQIDNNVTEKS
ncbi:hypothetical protein C2G38_2104352, partial [Gigaspora rosea]